jgi:hypothetical protein
VRHCIAAACKRLSFIDVYFPCCDFHASVSLRTIESVHERNLVVKSTTKHELGRALNVLLKKKHRAFRELGFVE